MGEFTLTGRNTCIFTDKEAFEGVKHIAAVVAGDIELVLQPEQAVKVAEEPFGDEIVFAGTIGHSAVIDRLVSQKHIDIAAIKDRREVYGLFTVSAPEIFGTEKNVLVIVGSDKRGTVYGLFAVSEACGVSPLVWWGDVKPQCRECIVFDYSAPFISKEPSVKYRGFFINDEWPAFGNWCNEHFGGFTAECYEQVFLLLLRLKGNYMWPAMWSSTFSEDGPGLKNAELADKLGVIMGASHHEPMCRAGEEWQHIYRQYGDDNTWSFTANREAISAFWKDGILRNRDFENVITIGMRGEADSKLLGEDATLEDNINVIKDAILTQHRLIRENICPDLSKVPRMLAIYKEVEAYYYGDEKTKGLREWDELKDVIFMLCEDNFGNTRGLPDEFTKNHPGGFGMYYHFDYHGAPVSYEWQNCVRLTRTWEQMTLAYEYGVRDLWIVNVGDLKGVEYPLCYFMDLAYDYEKWSKKNEVENYVSRFLDINFGSRIDEKLKSDMMEFIDGYTLLNSARRPETMTPGIYSITTDHEAERIHKWAGELIELGREIDNALDSDCRTAFESMFYYAAVASLNLIMMNIECGMNSFLAAKKSVAANPLRESIKKRIADDRAYIKSFHALCDGKWNHMMDSAHTNFASWDDYGWSYPVISEVIPVPGSKIIMGYEGSPVGFMGDHWQFRQPLLNDEFCNPLCSQVKVNVAMRGDTGFDYNVESDREWLVCRNPSGRVASVLEAGTTVIFTCDRSKLSGKDEAVAAVKVTFDDGTTATGRFKFIADSPKLAKGSRIYGETCGVIAFRAEHFSAKQDTAEGSLEVIDRLGKSGAALKAFPVNKSFVGLKDAPFAQYSFVTAGEGAYTAELVFVPRNPVIKGQTAKCEISVNGGERREVVVTDEHYFTEWQCKEWGDGVMTRSRSISVSLDLKKGLNKLVYYAGDPNVTLERVVIYPDARPYKSSYFGPAESPELE